MASKLIVFGDVPSKNEWRNRFMSVNERASFSNTRDVIDCEGARYYLRVLTRSEDVDRLRGHRFDDCVYIYPQLAKVPFEVIEAVQAYLIK